MAYIAVAVGVMWASTLVFVFGICRASAHADRQEQGMLTPAVPATPVAPGARPTSARAASRRSPAAAPARREAVPEIAAAAAARTRLLSR